MTIDRRNGRRVVQVTADINPRSKAGEVISDLRKNVLPEIMEKYHGLSYSFEGHQAEIRESLGSLKVTFVLAMLVFIIGVFVMAAMGLDLLTAIGVTAATLWNIGPGLGDVGPTDNYAHIPQLGKWVLSLLMLMGRLEIFTVVILFSPAYWRK